MAGSIKIPLGSVLLKHQAIVGQSSTLFLLPTEQEQAVLSYHRVSLCPLFAKQLLQCVGEPTAPLSQKCPGGGSENSTHLETTGKLEQLFILNFRCQGDEALKETDIILSSPTSSCPQPHPSVFAPSKYT